MNLEPIIGLEIHVQLATASKLFCACSNRGEAEPPNTTVCPVCLGHPGTLPVPNQQALDWAVKAALALNFEIPPVAKFDRKNYFYPDLPKGYQISQQDEPVGLRGWMLLQVSEDRERRIRLTRLHVEEDAAKSLHDPAKQRTLLDFNRSGSPLIEIVTEPDFHDPAEVKLFLTELRLLVRYLGISDGDMEKGHLRCDANISMRPAGQEKLAARVEIKNLNSFRSVERALNYEIKRQTALWEEEKPEQHQSTRSWDERTKRTLPMRVKEAMTDYRYFPEPDIPPLAFEPAYLERLQVDMPELPFAKRKRFREQYNLSFDDTARIVASHPLADYVEHVITELREWLHSENAKDAPVQWHENKRAYVKTVANWLLNKLLPLLAERGQDIRATKVTPENFAEFIKLVHDGRLHAKVAMQVLTVMVDRGADPSTVMDEQGLGKVMDDSVLNDVIDTVLKEHVQSVQDYAAGKKKALQFLVGMVLKETEGRADPKRIHTLLIHKLG